MREGGEHKTKGMERPCLSPEELVSVAEGIFSGAEAHLGACAACRGRLAAVASEPDDFPVPAPEPATLAVAARAAWREGRRRPVPRFLVPALGAAAALALGLAIVRLARPSVPPRPFTLPSGEALEGRSGQVRAPEDGPLSFSLPDGSRFRAAPRSAVLFHPPAAGERWVIRLARGSVEAEIAKESGTVRLVSAAGEVRVVGTSFIAKAFEAGGEAVLSVTVREGAVDLVSSGGTVRVAAGRRGIAFGPGLPVLQEAPPCTWRSALDQWGKDLERSAWSRVNLLAGVWEGLDRWEDLLAASDVPSVDRRRAAMLAAAEATSEDGARFRALLSEEKDPGVRRVLETRLKDWEGADGRR